MIESSLTPGEPVALPDRSFGRQLRSVIGYSLMTALMIMASLPVFVPAALLTCAIRNGRRVAWAVLVLTVTIVTLYALGAPPEKSPDLQKLFWSTMAGMVLMIALPSMAAMPMVERGEKFGRVLMFLMAGALVGMALTEVGSQTFLAYSPYAAQVAQAKEVAAQAVQVYRDNKMPADMIRFAERVFQFLVTVVPAQILIFVSFVFTISLLLLGRLKAWRDWVARRGDGETLRVYLFRGFQLPDWVLFAFIFGGLTPLTTGLLQKITANTLVVVVFLYMLQGLAVFRSLLVSLKAGPGGTFIAWSLLFVLTFMGGTSLLLLGLTGLFDPFFDFRHFKKRKDDSHESHSD